MFESELQFNYFNIKTHWETYNLKTFIFIWFALLQIMDFNISIVEGILSLKLVKIKDLLSKLFYNYNFKDYGISWVIRLLNLKTCNL